MKNIPLGIKIIGIGEVILGLFLVWGFINHLMRGSYRLALFPLLFSIAFIILGIGILHLRNTARIWSLRVMIILLAIVSLIMIFLGLGLGDLFSGVVMTLLACFIFSSPIYYLTCPKVKEQFK